jgi:hypothetical protein
MTDGNDGEREAPDEGRAPEPDEVAGPADGADAPSGAPRRRVWRIALLGAAAVFVLLVLGTKVAASDRFCSTCHATQPAALSAARSVHADVPCIVCHEGGGATAAVTYAPNLLREGVATITGWGVADGILPARDCTSCHGDLSTNPATVANHPVGQAQDCVECHGDVAHPELHLPGGDLAVTDAGHPEGFIQTHGGAAIDDPGSCAECHEQKFCEACHLKETFPHPPGWIDRHGRVEQQKGADTCTTCHGPSFCAGCHGTEIPHRADWLGQHDTDLQDRSTTPCMTCHPITDCSTCHSEHNVHREQDLYVLPDP